MVILTFYKFVSPNCVVSFFYGCDVRKHYLYPVNLVSYLSVYSVIAKTSFTRFLDLLPEAEGYRFSRFNKKGVVIYTYDEPLDTTSDRLAFGFMTRHQNGTIFRADSAISADYIEAKLVSTNYSVFSLFCQPTNLFL